MSRSPATIERYSELSEMLIRKYLKSTRNEFLPLEFLDYSIIHNIHLSNSTVRQYKSSLKWFFEQNYPDLIELAIDKLKIFTSKNKHTNSKRKKRKSYSEKDLLKLLDFLFNKINKSNCEVDFDIWENAYYTIKAGSLTGLRPSEWFDSFLHHCDDKAFLIVKNGKATNGRSHGEFRKIDITNLSSSDISAISKKIELSKIAILSGIYPSIKSYHKAVSAYLLRANNIIFPYAKKTFCSYTCRHQVSANLKVSGATAYEIAAILGHKSIETHRLHYPRKSKTGPVTPCSIAASLEDVVTVTQLNPNGPRDIGERVKSTSSPLTPTSSSSWGPKF